MHQEALTYVSDLLATGFMGFIRLWSADEAVCVRECVSTHLISRITNIIIIPIHHGPAERHIIKI